MGAVIFRVGISFNFRSHEGEAGELDVRDLSLLKKKPRRASPNNGRVSCRRGTQTREREKD